jgi:predicted ABC-type ATPase
MPEPTIYVLAGVNGSGKSSIGGVAFASRGVEYYNPDLAARKLLEVHPGMTQRVANSHAWALGKNMLEKAIAQKAIFALETTLGGNTITRLLINAGEVGIKVKVWYVGLDCVERNVARVLKRVAGGGHDIPEADIRRRWDGSRRNLIQLFPHLHSLRLYDNSHEADPGKGQAPRPELLLHVEAGKIMGPSDLAGAPEWAKPIISKALSTYEHA